MGFFGDLLNPNRKRDREAAEAETRRRAKEQEEAMKRAAEEAEKEWQKNRGQKKIKKD